METLKPRIFRLGNRCYRINPIGGFSNNQFSEEDYNYENEYQDEICDIKGQTKDCEISEEFDRLDINKTKNGFSLTLDNIPNECFKFIIGKQAETKRRLEKETNTKVTIPRQGIVGPIVIESLERQGIVSAKTRIDLLLCNSRKKISDFTHFFSINVANDMVQNNFKKFKESVLKMDDIHGLENLFQKAEKLHLTLCTSVLFNEKEIGEINKVLKKFKTDCLGQIKSIEAKIEGLDIMNDDSSQVDVLYAKIESQQLQDIVNELCNRLYDTDYVKKQYSNVKLHVTLMNSTFDNRKSFDCASIIETYGDYFFGYVTIKSIELSKRYSTAQDGYYESVVSLKFG